MKEGYLSTANDVYKEAALNPQKGLCCTTTPIWQLPELNIPEEPMAGRQLLSKEAVTIAAQTIQKGVATEDLAEALEVGYRGFGEIACSDAAKEGISAFLERRKPEFKK